MAIKQDIIESKFGLNVPNAYIKLAYVSWSDKDKRLIAQFSVWTSATAEADGKEVIEHIPIDVTNLLPQLQALAYAEIKKLSKYNTAINV